MSDQLNRVAYAIAHAIHGDGDWGLDAKTAMEKRPEEFLKLAQAAIDAMSGWRPIEEAPKDGTYVLIWLRAPFSRVEKARWCKLWQNWQVDDEEYSETAEYCGIGSEVPTHWIPLPPAPKEEA